MSHPRTRLSAALLGVTLLALTGCGAVAPAAPKPAASPKPPSSSSGSAAAAQTPQPGARLTPVTFLLDGPLTGYYAPFFAAIANGYYKQAGLQVKILPGRGSVNSVQQVGHSNYTFASADVTAAALGISKGIPVKVVAIYLQKSPLAFVYRTSAPITRPADLAGKTIAVSPGSAGAKLLPAFLAMNHVPASKVRTVDTASIPAMMSALAQHRVDASLIIGIYAIPILASKGVSAGQMLMAGHGISLLSNGIIANDAYIKAHPRIVRGFVQASMKGWTFAARHPAQAIAAETKLAGGAGMKVPAGAAQMLKLALPLTQSPDTQGHPMGWMSAKAWSTTLQALHQYEGMAKVLPAASYYTNRFIGG